MRSNGSGIGDIEVKKTDLITILKVNAKGHKDVYERALVTYREKAIQSLDEMITQVRNGNVINLWVSHLPTPESHTDDYVRVINMLYMHQGETIVLSESAYRKLVDDEWEWSNAWLGNTMAYATGGIQ